MTGLQREIERLGLALVFLTRLPLRGPDPWPEDGLARAARYFPLVGALVGLIAGLVWLGALGLGLPPLPAAALALCAQLLLTGALHEDGLADCADGLGGGATRERALEIMRDSRIGTYGALALGMSLILRIAALASLGGAPGLAALILAHTVARTAIVSALVSMDYARETGLASGARGTSGAEAGIALILALLAALVLGGAWGLAALLAGLGAMLIARQRLNARLGGYTGDGLGLIAQLAEITVLLVLCAAWA
ncbi:adenosylcobinamide-GDP ribazoletransferase [Oceanibium sediminis]|uniref:adenosylcobinamide-GDP ribazoletransferase n=1 Tax=Oceanibium sediminis TaxID=2026339 RepID=UPI000DD4E385|nr:adenosylcobinamide-GDP ribazoletransferase [Oceanibium sediminis]